MEGSWNLLKEFHDVKSNEIEALSYVPADSPWFTGHFPGEPILPGIALVHALQQVILQNAKAKDENVRLDALKRIRFVQPVRPGEELKINITREDTEDKILFSFRITSRENIVCNGLLIAKKE